MFAFNLTMFAIVIVRFALFWASQFSCVVCQKLIWTKPIYYTDRQRLSWTTATRVD